ncbi:MAG: glucokinase [Gammaproteobacteria bacterium]|nr:glucokinase [Gammaproteobacteria bacterium]
MEAVDTCLVADIGGTKARFALVDKPPDSDGLPQIRDHRVLRCADYSGLEGVLENYLEQIAPLRPQRVCLAVAGPVNDDVIRMTNRPWQFSAAALRSRYGFHQLEIINDVAALAYGTVFAPPDAIRTIKSGAVPGRRARVAVAIGTGLGVAVLLPEGSGWKPIPGEGGHAGLAPVTALERELHRRLGSEREHVSWETVLSGAGLVRLHRLLAEIEGHAVATNKEAGIIEQCRAGDAAAMKTLSQFSKLLGGFTGDAVLAANALSGAFLGGGLLLAFDPFIDYESLIARFRLKGPMSEAVREVPIFSLDSEHWLLIGAAAWLDAVAQAA